MYGDKLEDEISTLQIPSQRRTEQGRNEEIEFTATARSVDILKAQLADIARNTAFNELHNQRVKTETDERERNWAIPSKLPVLS